MRLTATAATALIGASIFSSSVTTVTGVTENFNINQNTNVSTIEKADKPAKVVKTKAKALKSKKIVTVLYGDSLSLIAKKHGSTYKRIFYANKNLENPDLIYPGTKLRIPLSTEKLKTRALPAGIVAPAPQPVVAYAVQAPAPAPQPQKVVGGSVWDQLAACESGGNWQINTGNGYYGGLQFTASTWASVGGSGLPHQHSREEQIKRGQILQARSGWGQWPACAAKLGLI